MLKVYRGSFAKKFPSAKRSIAIGIFDGVHRGHQKILLRMIRRAQKIHAIPAVVTFDPHPLKVLAPKKYHPTILMSLEHRLRIFEEMGVREVFVIPFTKSCAKVNHDYFLKKFLMKKLGLRALATGNDFRFGSRALGDTAYLARESKKQGFYFDALEPVRQDGETISSTRIRSLIEQGELKKASRMLGRPVSVVGTVVRGRGRGKRVGFPTANLNPHHEALPPSGVYAAYGVLGKRRLRGVLHIGPRPTFRDRQKSLEVHFLNFHQNVYGQEVELIFVARLRSIRRFQNPEALQKAISEDIRRAKKSLF